MEHTANARLQRITLLVGAVIVLAAAPAGAERLYQTVLTSSQEVPPNASTAIGLATIILSDDMTTATYHVEYSGLSAPETAAHFHLAPAGTNGPVIFPLPLGTPKDGVWLISPAHVTALDAMEVYVNVHTTMYPGGEIRGNFCFAAVSDEDTSWGNIKALYRE
jgi:hypothetical protein